MSKRMLRRAVSDLDIAKKDRDLEIPGILGFTVNGSNVAEVPGRDGFVYVRLRNNLNELIQAYNDQVSPVYNLPVIVIRDEVDKSRYRVKGRDLGVYQNWGSSSYVTKHGNQHSFNTAAGGGGDITWIYSRQFMYLAVIPSGSSGAGSVTINEGAFYRSNAWHYAGGTGTSSLLGFKPTGSNARIVLIYVDDNDNPATLAGDQYFAASITGNAAILPFTPTMTGTSGIPLAAVRLVSGTSTVGWNNIYDLRSFVVGQQGA